MAPIQPRQKSSVWSFEGTCLKEKERSLIEDETEWGILLIGDPVERGYRSEVVMENGPGGPRRSWYCRFDVPAADPEHTPGCLVRLACPPAEEAHLHRGWAGFDSSVGAWTSAAGPRLRRRPPSRCVAPNRQSQGSVEGREIHRVRIPSPVTWIESTLIGLG